VCVCIDVQHSDFASHSSRLVSTYACGCVPL